MKLLAIYQIALWMFLEYKVAYCASLQENEKIVVKRQADIVQTFVGGAFELGINAFDTLSKGFGAYAKSETDVDILGQGFHQKEQIGGGLGGAQNERKKRSTSSIKEIFRRKRSTRHTHEPVSLKISKRSPGAGCGRNGTAAGGSNSTITTRETNPNAETLTRRKRYSPNSLAIGGNTNFREKRSPQGPPNGFPPGPPPNGPPPNGPWPGGPPPNGPPPNGPWPSGPPPNGPQPSGPPLNGTQLVGNGPAERKKRSPKPCDGNGQPIGNGNQFPVNNNIQSQPVPQQQQRLPNGDVTIGDLQRDQRVKRSVEDPDKVVPVGNGEEKNIFERLSDFVMETLKRVGRWASESDREKEKPVDKGTTSSGVEWRDQVFKKM